MDDNSKTNVTPASDSQNVYEAPALTPLGTVDEMTQAVGNSGAPDGGLKTGDGG